MDLVIKNDKTNTFKVENIHTSRPLNPEKLK